MVYAATHSSSAQAAANRLRLAADLHSPSAAPFRFPHPHPHPHPLSPADPLSLRLEPALVHSFLRSLAHLRLHLSFYAGAWDALSPGVFDMVLTSETIYRPSSLPALARCIQRCLAPSDSSASAAPSTGATPGGRAYVAAKEVYFGVGGSVREFAHVVRGQGMHVQRRWETREGSGRCVLELWRA
ncbi:hypothetical protein CALCODRAFT_500219 [Calocera cornea HHB12733]|uniref:Uncharacterized protein n=1 Tax=Calocera cornea HHB12733 TaxID=1353952 RepID=A0A165E673_9BASI|nr:hypothetical protein CALCODRAFT_500219 [Calocera cornea HHB12733]